MTDHTSALMTALDFTTDDINANRQGNLSKPQTARIKKLRQRNIIIGVIAFFVIVLIATTLIYVGQRNENLILSGVGGLLTVLNAVMMGILGRSYMRTTADLRDGGVEMLEGKLERIVKRGKQGDNYMVRIDQAEIYVTKEIFLQLKHEKPYRLYRTRLSGVLLSAERS
jgi:hypothetical protein